MKRCAHCNSRLGLGVRFENYFVSFLLGWAHKRFCGARCNELYNERIKEERRALSYRAWLLPRPP